MAALPVFWSAAWLEAVEVDYHLLSGLESMLNLVVHIRELLGYSEGTSPRAV